MELGWKTQDKRGQGKQCVRQPLGDYPECFRVSLRGEGGGVQVSQYVSVNTVCVCVL